MSQKEIISLARWARIRLFAMDVDGILTDGRVLISSDGSESKAFSVLDGLGLARAREAGIELAWISGRPSEATSMRATELKIKRVIQGQNDKETCLREIMESLSLTPEEVCYMGDDLIDLPALSLAGIGVTVPEAGDEIRHTADWITSRAGGYGAVREVCDRLVTARDNQPSPKA
jgi:3-deoxy-D-manno-octulosonate 8-phosphate phosphatase (KDO 8-P phosphatase)